MERHRASVEPVQYPGRRVVVRVLVPKQCESLTLAVTAYPPLRKRKHRLYITQRRGETGIGPFGDSLLLTRFRLFLPHTVETGGQTTQTRDAKRAEGSDVRHRLPHRRKALRVGTSRTWLQRTRHEKPELLNAQPPKKNTL